jgi:hypothetical protein
MSDIVLLNYAKIHNISNLSPYIVSNPDKIIEIQDLTKLQYEESYNVIRLDMQVIIIGINDNMASMYDRIKFRNYVDLRKAQYPNVHFIIADTIDMFIVNILQSSRCCAILYTKDKKEYQCII